MGKKGFKKWGYGLVSGLDYNIFFTKKGVLVYSSIRNNPKIAKFAKRQRNKRYRKFLEKKLREELEGRLD